MSLLEGTELEIATGEDVQSDRTSASIEPLSDPHQNGMTRSQAWNLYTSHFLSTGNIRTYIIFTAATYPDTLIASSIRGIVRTLASICFASIVGRWVDHAPHRLKTLSSTISVNRISVISASALWFFMVRSRSATQGSLQSTSSITQAMFGLILFLEVLESLSASGNMLSMERDFVVTAADPDGQSYDLTHLNSVMRRIDLICKLIAPILISVIVSATSVQIGVFVVGAMSTASWVVELLCAKRVWDLNPRLRVLKTIEIGVSNTVSPSLPPSSSRHKISQALRRYGQDFENYFSSEVWIPSMSLSFLHISVLTYSATFMTFLLNAGFSLDLITIARAAGSVVEISSTVVTPIGIHYLSKTKGRGRIRGVVTRANEDSEDSGVGLLERFPEQQTATETGLERLGLWGISWQLLNLVPVVFALWSLSPDTTTTTTLSAIVSRILGPIASQPLLAFTLFFFLSISRLGLWIFDLTTQQLTQTMNPTSQRSSFTGVEYSFVSLFGLAQHIVAIVLHRPEQFKWIALMSLGATAISTVAHAGWVWKMRGHLVHWDRIGKGCECVKVRLRQVR
ncbi:Solute carrier family 40 member [Lachnellula hyalina]|uniref:Solute carrier family 40 member n=1 Tax=Lachnellula hyalina TaxID=1316788 RepID=A0A8H8R2L2_9HELO|nr:Solute carrier family 40 member [Lachnellula hyalina]TVY26526.1 Solute carrier family 40 member [Lachnellula hyalina]